VTDPDSFRELLVEHRTVQVSKLVDGELLGGLSPEASAKVVEHAVLGAMLFELRDYVWSEHLVEQSQTVSWQTPASWWDHWKLDHREGRLAWLVARLAPVSWHHEQETVRFDAYEAYPQAHTVLGAHVRHEQIIRTRER
jgi:hypothetical protein